MDSEIEDMREEKKIEVVLPAFSFFFLHIYIPKKNPIKFFTQMEKGLRYGKKEF